MKTIKFIRKHTQCFEYYKTGQIVFYDEDNMELEVPAPDLSLMICSEEMADYLIRRAEYLYDFLYAKLGSDFQKRRNDLQNIIALLEKAGIEVVYE